MFERPTHIYLTPVAADRAEQFERFLLDVVVPAVLAQRPALHERWHLLRPDVPEEGDPAISTYALVFDGGDLDEDWDLDRLLEAEHGKEQAVRLLEEWSTTLVPLTRWLATLAGRESAEPQLGWTFRAVT